MILVVGATGSLGGRIVRKLLVQKKPVRVLDRKNPISLELARQGRANFVDSFIQAGAEAVDADLKDRASLERALDGVETVITTANAVQRGGDDTLESVDFVGTRNLIQAGKEAGVRRFIYISALGASPDHPVPLYRYKALNELELEKSGMDFSIIQPTIFMEVWIGMVVGIPLMTRQPILLIGKGDHHHNFVSEADVASLVTAALENPLASRKKLPAGGAASYSWSEIVEAAQEVLNAPVPFQYVPAGSEIAYLPKDVQGIFAGMETFESYLDMADTAQTFGITLTSLDQFPQAMLNPPG